MNTQIDRKSEEAGPSPASKIERKSKMGRQNPAISFIEKISKTPNGVVTYFENIIL